MPHWANRYKMYPVPSSRCFEYFLWFVQSIFKAKETRRFWEWAISCPRGLNGSVQRKPHCWGLRWAGFSWCPFCQQLCLLWSWLLLMTKSIQRAMPHLILITSGSVISNPQMLKLRPKQVNESLTTQASCTSSKLKSVPLSPIRSLGFLSWPNS